MRLRTAADTLNPVLVAAGFASAQFGGPPLEPSGVTYCASSDDFATRNPTLPQARAHEPGTGACVDLVIQVDANERITELHLEGVGVEETCRAAGYVQEADAVAAVIGSDVLDAVASLRPVLITLFAPNSH